MMITTEIPKPDCFNILIVDDQKDIHVITKNVFLEERFLSKDLNFISKYNEVETIEYLKKYEHDIAVIVLDIVMKEHDGGLSVIEFLRKILHNDIIQIIIRSGYSRDFPMRSLIASYDINGYITKGETTADDLYVTIRSAIRTFSALKNLTDLTFELKSEIKNLTSYDQEKMSRVIDPRVPKSQNVLLFVHGLAGTNERWDEMITVIKDDKDFYIPFDIREYSYPTTLYNWKIYSKYPSIPSISDGLKTYIKNHLSDYSTILIVAHSMGGLAARKLLVDEFKNPIIKKNLKVILFSTPNKGSPWANLTFFIQIGNVVIPQMRRNSKFIRELNEDWKRFGIKDKYRLKYVIAGRDNLVDTFSPKDLFNEQDIETIIDKTHTSIGKPKNCDDLSYKVLKRFALGID